MWRSEPQIPLDSMRTIPSSPASSRGSGFSSTRTCSAAWKVTARIRPGTVAGERSVDAGDLEAAGAALGAGGLGDPGLERQLLLEVGRLAVLEGDVLAFEQLDEHLDVAGVELFA